MENLRYLPLSVRSTAAQPDENLGLVEAYTSVFDTPYVIDERGSRESVAPGAFRESIERQSSIPVFWQHDHRNGGAPIGVATNTEDDTGLLSRSELWLDDPKARAVYRALRSGAIREWSIGFAPTETDERGRLTVVRGADLREVSVVLMGANPATDTLAVRFVEKQPDEPLPPLPLHRWL